MLNYDYIDTSLGSLPKEWKVVRLREVASFTRKPRGLHLPLNIPFIPMELVPQGHVYINSYEFRDEVSSGTYCEKGDFLLPKITPSFENGKQGIIGEIPGRFAYATTEVIPIKASSSLDRLYLFYYFLQHPVRADLAGKMEGTTGRQRIPKPVVSNMIRVHLPNCEHKCSYHPAKGRVVKSSWSII